MSTVLKVSEAASLALHTMVLLAASSDRLWSTHDIATTLGASEAHLSKVLQRLAKVELVKSVRGPKGGFSLARSPERIFLLEVYESIEGPLGKTNCLLEHQLCDGTNCILGTLLKDTNREVKKYLSKTKLSSLTDLYRSMIENDQKNSEHRRR
ncbi:MAG: Rrf2 family transcriptional regulator [Planctomycetes bacterium]|nr:Rrf2 family transcriptional regulator [Planctomycetota bacterium]